MHTIIFISDICWLNKYTLSGLSQLYERTDFAGAKSYVGSLQDSDSYWASLGYTEHEIAPITKPLRANYGYSALLQSEYVAYQGAIMFGRHQNVLLY